MSLQRALSGLKSSLAAARLMPVMRALLVAAISVLMVACGDDAAPGGGSGKQDPFFSTPASARPKAPPTGAPAPAAARHGKGAAPGGTTSVEDLPPLPVLELTEADFTETDKNRDPFRSFSKTFVAQAKGRVTVQRVVLAERFALDELKPVGIVSRGDIKGLLTDPTGLGWIVKIGDYVGKAEVVHTGGPTGSDVAINWRVDRIRENDIVFIREDPSHPEIPPSTRVIVLYPSDQIPGSPGGPPPVTRP